MAVSLYTSRVVLQVLGVDDYGVYAVVGGIVSLFSFINGSMSSATSRFLTFEMGKDNKTRLRDTFNAALCVHVIISLFVILFAETIGLWFLNNKMDIPEASMYAANWVYQFSIFASVISITQCPYNAAIIAHEKMGVYAYLEIVSTILRLLIVFLLVILPVEKLIAYAALVLIVNFLMSMLYRIYCIKKFDETKISIHFDRSLIKPMLCFSGWDLYGNLSTVCRSQGVNILINMFFGVVANTASGIASQIQGAVGAFSSNIITAIRPQIIKSYATEDIDYMIKLIKAGIRITFILISFLALPIIVEIHFVLGLWLGIVPPYAEWICRLTLLFLLFSTTSSILVTGVHATGKIKRPSIINGSLYLSVIPLSYITFKLGGSVYIPFVLNAVFVFCGALINLYTLKLYINQVNYMYFITRVIIPCILVSSLSLILPIILTYSLPQGFLRFIITCLTVWICLLLLSYFKIFDTYEKNFIRGMLARIKEKLFRSKNA